MTIIRGTYAHPDLVPHIASWASPKFAAKVSKIVNEYLINEVVQEKDRLIKKKDKLIKKKNNKINKMSEKIDILINKNDKMDRRIKRLLAKNDDLYDQNEEIINKVDTISNRCVVSTSNDLNNNMLVIIKNNDDPEEYEEDQIIYQYHALRVMNKSYKNRILEHKRRHPNMEILLTIEYSPNLVNLWIRVKESLGEGRRRKIKYDNCKFNLRRNYTEEELLRDVKNIHDERFNQ